MRKVEPKVYLIAETAINQEELDKYLRHVGAFDWHTDAGSDSEMLVEFMGRLCYRSWKPGLNANVKKVREGNYDYLANIIKSQHGSCLEHASVSFVFADVSRVFTHELCRHRAGVAISQESLRFVRLDDIGFWAPTIIREDEHAMTIFSKTVEELERLQKELAQYFKLDDEGVSFTRKKTVTSAMRRIAPDGLATTIGWTANFRTLRHVIEMRTSRHAEEEIRLVFGAVARRCRERFPNFFGDMKSESIDGYEEFSFETRKV